MNPRKSPPPGDANEAVSALIAALHETEQRLEELTAGEMDTADRDGRTLVLRRAQDQLRYRDAAKQTAILNALPAHIALLDAEGLIISVNEAWRRFATANVIQGPGHGVGLNYLEICSTWGDGSSEAHQVAEGIRSVLAGRAKSFSIEYPCHSPTEQRWFLLTVTPLVDDHPNGAVVMHLDITERKRASDALRESERRFSDMLGNVDMVSVMVDRDGRISYCNDYLLQLTGYRREEVIGRDWFERFIAEPSIPKANFAALLANRPEARHRESEILTRSGERRVIRWNNSVLRSGAGDVIGTASIGEDITDQKKNQESLRQNEERTRLIVESALDAVVVMDATGRITDWNTQAEKTFGWSREQAVGMQLTETIVPPKYREAHKRGLRAFLETGEGAIINKRIEIPAMHRDGHEIPVELTISAVRLGGAWIFSSFIRDLTERKRADEALAQLRRQSELILESVGEGIHGIDTEGRIIFENPAAAKLLGYSIEELSGKLAHATMHYARKDGTPYPIVDCPIHTAMHDGAICRVEDEVFWRKDGSSFPVEYTTAPIRNDGNDITGAVVAFRDITDRKEAETRIRRLNRVYAMLSGINTPIVRARDRGELFREACRIAVEHGRFKMAWIGVVDRSAMKIVPIASAGAEPEFLTLIKDSFSLREDAPLGNTMSARVVNEKKAIVTNEIRGDSKVFFAKERIARGISSMAILPLLVSEDAVGILALYAGEPGFFDEEEMKLLTELAGNIAFAIDHIDKQERLDYLAYYDVLTGLANRSLFLERVALHTRSAVSDGHKLALFLVDLERFKNINDSLGQAAGDSLLRQVAEWLTHNVGDASLLARVSADHFAVVLPKVKQEGDVARVVEKTMEAFLEHPFRLNDAVFRVAAKVGVALFPDDGADADDLFKNAEAALKKAKASGDRYLFYTQKMTATVAGKLTLENQLRQALAREEFVLHYQPKVNLLTGKLTGAEALIRWNDPRTGLLVPPVQFIPILEETGLIYEVGRWALRKAIADYLRWRTAGLAAVRIAVNVSPLQLRHRGFIADIERAIGIDAQAAAGLELEITENMIMEDVKQSIASLQAIRDMGVSIAIDDFGTGFSSLSYLSKLPVDTLKIDRSFVTDMTTGPQGLALVSTIISLAHSLTLKVVAEGVETEEQSRLLRLLKCDEMQGYLFSKPVPSEIFEPRFLARLRTGDE
jgi:diguanylate cyclase (GGDEF)-like protein/PAS domain S-box-containing protein